MRWSGLAVALCAVLALSPVACAPAAPVVTPPAPTAPATALPTEAAQAATSAPQPATAMPTAEAAGSPVPLSAPTGVDDCLVGEWEMEDLSGYVTTVLPAEVLVEEDWLHPLPTSGSLSYVLSYDSSVTMIADAYTFNYALNMSGAPPMSIQVILDGASRGHFSTAADSLTLGEGTPDDLTVTVVVAGQTAVVETAKVASWMPLGTAQEMTYSYTCDGDILQMLPPVPNAVPITLKRVQG